MSFYIKNAIDNHSLKAIVESLSDRSLFIDGKTTAGGSARNVKDNVQANPAHAAVASAIGLIEKRLISNQAVKTAVYPDKFAKTIISRYERGMRYGQHIDESTINQTRVDVAFTLFLSNPDSYEGGELEIMKSDGRDSIKLNAGDAYIYSANTIHQVLPVTSGVRLAAVGWLRSRVRLEHQREMLHDLSSALAEMPIEKDSLATRLKLLKVRGNLERLWCD